MDSTTEKSVAVLGLGKFGRSLARNLYNLGADVLVVDSDEDVISDFSANSTSAIKANLNNEDEVVALRLENMDVVVTAMGSNLAASIMCVSVAKDHGVPLVIAKSDSSRMGSILKKVGADRIIDPEEEGGARAARILVSSYLNECFKLDENMMMVEMVPKPEWLGHSLNELDLRKALNINIVAMRQNGGLWHFVEPDVHLEKDMNLLIVMERKTMVKLRGGK